MIFLIHYKGGHPCKFCCPAQFVKKDCLPYLMCRIELRQSYPCHNLQREPNSANEQSLHSSSSRLKLLNQSGSYREAAARKQLASASNLQVTTLERCRREDTVPTTTTTHSNTLRDTTSTFASVASVTSLGRSGK